jgi:hypothetical protein
MAIGWASLGLSAKVAVAAQDLTETARAVLIAYTKATLAGSKVLSPMLAPEFQIMRTNGVGYDRAGYLNRGVRTIFAEPDFSHEDIVATVHGDIMVVRYFLRINEVILGNPVKKRAPRLTVFRQVAGAWKVVAHSNFGATK